MSPILGSFGALAARAWKTAGGAFSVFSDNFNRTTTGLLGTSSSGGLWAALRGVWFADGTAAKSTDAANTYPIAQVEMTKADVTASISTGAPGTIISTTGTVQSVTAGGTAGFYTAQIINLSTTTGFAVGQWIFATNGTGSLYGGTPDYVEIISIDSSTAISYRIKGGTAPTAGTVTNVGTRNRDGGSGVALWITDSGNWWGVSYGRGIDTQCNCSSCLSSFCGAYTITSYSFCPGGYQGSNVYFCPGGYSSWTGNSLYTQYGAPFYCPAYAGYLCVSGFVGTFVGEYWATSTTYDCPGGYAVNYVAYCTGGISTYYAVSCSSQYYTYITCNCQTCYPPYIRIFQSASNVVSEITRWTLSSMAAAFRVITNSSTKVITIRPYKETSMTTQIGTDLTYNASTATMANKFGIVLSPSDQIQGNQSDDFNITSN